MLRWRFWLLCVLVSALPLAGYGQAAMYQISASELNNIEQQLQTQRSALRSLEAALETQREITRSLRETLSKAESELNALENRLDSSLTTSADLRRQIQMLRMRADELQAQLKRLRAQFAEYENAARGRVRTWQIRTAIAGVGGTALGIGIGLLIAALQ